MTSKRLSVSINNPALKETGYVVFIRYLFSGFNTFYNRHKSRTQKRAEAIKPSLNRIKTALKQNEFPLFNDSMQMILKHGVTIEQEVFLAVDNKLDFRGGEGN
jgi:type II secretory pathway component PulF